MLSKNLFGFCSSHGSFALALVCSACSADGTDSPSVPRWTDPGIRATPAPAAPGAGAPPAGAGAVADPVAPAATNANMPAAPTSETPIVPQLQEPQSSGDGDNVDQNGATPNDETSQGGEAMGAAGAAATPENPPPGGESEGQPSAMCGAGAGSPSFNIPNTLFSVPASYDGNTPLPVVIAFHAAGNPNTQLRGILGDTLDDQYIMFYPKSAGNGWTNQDSPKVDAIFNALDAAACYDKNRVFATGHSSGAQFIVQRLCAGESRWRAVAPVASSVYCSSWEPIPALVIHGIGDTEREAYGLDDGDGLKDIVPYRTSNGCMQSSTPVQVQGCNSGGVQVNPGCRDFDGCGEQTRWCQHNDPQYGTSHHGVPCFGARVIKDFFDGFR